MPNGRRQLATRQSTKQHKMWAQRQLLTILLLLLLALALVAFACDIKVIGVIDNCAETRNQMANYRRPRHSLRLRVSLRSGVSDGRIWCEPKGGDNKFVA